MAALIEKIVLAIFEFFSQKESAREDPFCVRAPKWLFPFIVFYEIFFCAFAVFSYRCGAKIAVPFFIFFCALGIFAFIFDGSFKIQFGGQEIVVTRFLKGRKRFLCSEILSARKDNAGAVSVLIGTEKIKIDSTMINKDVFFGFAQYWAFKNAESKIAQRYKIRRERAELWILAAVIFVFAGFFVLILKSPLPVFEKRAFLILVAALDLIFAVYFARILTGSIIVDEKWRCIVFRKRFSKKTVFFSEIQSLKIKKRFLESASDYILTFSNSGGTLRFCTLDENSDRLANLLIREFSADGF